MAQASAALSFSDSWALVEARNMSQAKFHSFSPPAAMPLQYIVDLRLGWILSKDEDSKVKLVKLIPVAALGKVILSY